jgi:hypothetical protein
MKLTGSSEQAVYHYLYRADGSIATGGTPQLVLGRSVARSHLLFQNTSNGPLWIEIGTGAATATLSNGGVASVSVVNAGFGFSAPPLVRFFGGGNAYGNTSFTGSSQPNFPGPNSVGPAGRIARARCVMTGSAPSMSISSIVVDDPGAGYVIAPYVAILNSDLDPNGAAAPADGVGIFMNASAAPLIYNGTVCPTDPVAVWGATTGQTFTCRWLD